MPVNSGKQAGAVLCACGCSRHSVGRPCMPRTPRAYVGLCYTLPCPQYCTYASAPSCCCRSSAPSLVREDWMTKPMQREPQQPTKEQQEEEAAKEKVCIHTCPTALTLRSLPLLQLGQRACGPDPPRQKSPVRPTPTSLPCRSHRARVAMTQATVHTPYTTCNTLLAPCACLDAGRSRTRDPRGPPRHEEAGSWIWERSSSRGAGTCRWTSSSGGRGPGRGGRRGSCRPRRWRAEGWRGCGRRGR